MTTQYIITARTFLQGQWVNHILPQIVGEYTSRRDVVRGIVGDDLADVVRIVEVIADEQVISDITREIALSVLDALDRSEPCPERLVDFIESNCSGFVRRAA